MVATIDVEGAEALLRERMPPWVLELRLKVLEVAEGSVLLALPASATLEREGGIIGGQALMALADTAMVTLLFAALGASRPIATVDMHTAFLRPATGSLLAAASFLRLGRSMAFCQARIVRDTLQRELVAHSAGTYALP